jgi:hypothetical protein
MMGANATTAARRHGVGFWLIAFVFVTAMAFSTVPTPLYPLYQARGGFSTFTVTQRAIGLSWVLVGFAVLCVVAMGFVRRFLPETNGLSVEQITTLFDKEAAQQPARAA